MTPNTPRQFTSSPTKFLRHPNQLMAYRNGTGNTVISTHIAMTASCNLKCSYCAYSKRDRSQQIELSVMKDYVEKLAARGLRSVTLTGGGEPTLHPQFNEFVEWLSERGLAIGLITNGTTSNLINCWDKFAWLRVSANMFDGWQNRILIARHRMKEDAAVGCSMIFEDQSVEELRDLTRLADKIDASYIRIFPQYLLSPEARVERYEELERRAGWLADPRISILRSIQRAPACRKCHLSHFRPFLSEEDGGTVHLCCVSILAGDGRMPEAQRICKAGDVLDFLDGKIRSRVVPEHDCGHCTYPDAVEALDAWTCDHLSPHDLFV